MDSQLESTTNQPHNTSYATLSHKMTTDPLPITVGIKAAGEHFNPDCHPPLRMATAVVAQMYRDGDINPEPRSLNPVTMKTVIKAYSQHKKKSQDSVFNWCYNKFCIKKPMRDLFIKYCHKE